MPMPVELTDEQKTGLHKPQEWAEMMGLCIYDPDGWRKKGDPDFDAPTDWDDFYPRFCTSTVGPIFK